jgi:hypothetical protein
MRDEISKLRESQVVDGLLGVSLPDKARDTWNEEAMQILLAQLGRLRTALDLLLPLNA